MKFSRLGLTVVALVLILAGAASWAQPDRTPPTPPLPAPQLSGGMPLAEALATRRSIRQFAPTPLTPPQLGQLCWAAQGITDAQGKRTAPSAGALYPVELFLVTPTGVQHYKPQTHTLEPHLADDLRPDLSRAALSAETIACAGRFRDNCGGQVAAVNTARGPSVIASWKPDTWRERSIAGDGTRAVRRADWSVRGRRSR